MSSRVMFMASGASICQRSPFDSIVRGLARRESIMAYALLIVEREDRRTRSPEARRNSYDRMVRFGDDLRARGVLTASESLRPDTEGVRVELRDSKRIVTEGPFAESKEFVGGFFLLDCGTRDEAI